MSRRLLDIALICSLLLMLLTACQAEGGSPVLATVDSISATQTAQVYLNNLASLAATAASLNGPGIGLIVSPVTASPLGESQAFATTTPNAPTPQPGMEEPTSQVESPQITPLTQSELPASVWDTGLQPVRFAGCNRVEFVRDITTPDDSLISPGSLFEKTWRLKNAGTCAWTSDYQLVFVDGAQMQGQPVPLPGRVAPGEAINLSVDLSAPADPGSYKGLWMVQGPYGRFGMGQNALDAFWVKIQVPAPAVSATPPPPLAPVYLAQELCSAQWQTNLGVVACPADSNSPNGFAVKLDNPALETRNENELALYTHPPLVPDSWISGTYPPFVVQPGDRFLADIGCLANFTGCQVEFVVAYAPVGGGPIVLGRWVEQNDRSVARVDLDLSGLAGQNIQLILTVYSLGDSGQAGAAWLVPQIQR